MKSLTKRYEEATPLTPRPRVIGKESGLIQLTFRKQLSFSRVFDLLLEKSDEDKLGKYPHLKFRLTWDEDKPVLLISFHEEEEQPLSLRINSVYPKNTLGFGSILDALSDKGIHLDFKFGWRHVWTGDALEIDVLKKRCVLKLRDAEHIQIRRKAHHTLP